MRIDSIPLPILALGLAFALGSLSCAPAEDTAMEEAPMEASMPSEMSPPVTRAVAVLHPTEGNDLQGIVHFTQMGQEIQVVAEVQGIAPGMHGFHIHQYGDCSAPDATSAGGHFSPMGNPHGAPGDAARHVGDLGNLSADEQGMARLTWTDPMIAFSGAHSILGRAVIVHAGQDDLTSQPTGNAGGRVACGVIGIAGAEEGQG